MEQLNRVPVLETESVLHQTDVLGDVTSVEALHGFKIQKRAEIGDIPAKILLGRAFVQSVAQCAVSTRRIKHVRAKLRCICEIQVEFSNRVNRGDTSQVDVRGRCDTRKAPLGTDSVSKNITSRVKLKHWSVKDRVFDLSQNLLHHRAIGNTKGQLRLSQVDAESAKVGNDLVGCCTSRGCHVVCSFHPLGQTSDRVHAIFGVLVDSILLLFRQAGQHVGLHTCEVTEEVVKGVVSIESVHIVAVEHKLVGLSDGLPSFEVLRPVDHLVPSIVGAHVDRKNSIIGVLLRFGSNLVQGVVGVVGDDRLLRVPHGVIVATRQ